MGKRDIEKYFRDELKGYSKEVDTDAIWSALDLDEPKKKKRPFFFWFTGFLLLVFLGAIIYQSNKLDDLHNEKVIHKGALEVQDNYEDKTLESIATTVIEEEAPIITKSSSLAIQELGNKKILTDDLNQRTNVNDKFYKGEREQINGNTNFSTTATSDKPRYNGEINNKNASINLKTEKLKLALDSREDTSRQNVESIGSSETFVESLTRNSLLIPLFLETLDLNALKFSSFSETTMPQFAIEEIQTKQNKHRLSLDIYSGIYNVSRNLTIDNPEGETFISIIENTESPLDLFSAGAQVKYNIGAMYIRTGIEFQSLNERFKYAQSIRVDTVSAEGVVGILIDPNGVSKNQFGIVLEENTLTSNWINHNNHRLITIPVGLGYEKKVKKWTLSAEGQALFNFYHSFSGRRLNQNNIVVENDDSRFSSFNLGVGVSVGMGYDLTNNVSVYLRPHYFRSISSFVKESENYTQKYKLYGLQVGLNHRLF